MKALYAILAFCLIAGTALAQNTGALTQQVPTRLDAATNFCTTNQQNTVNQQNTATCAPNGGQFVYLTSIYFDVCTNGTGTAANQVSFTTTNLTGGPSFSFSIAATASICQHWGYTFPTPIKSQASGTNVTIVSPAAATNNSYSIVATFYSAN